MGCVLHYYSDTDSFKDYAKTTRIPVYSVHDKNEKRGKRVIKEYRISFDVTDKDFDDFDGQVKDVIKFLNEYKDDMIKFVNDYNINDNCLDFPFWSTLGDEMVGGKIVNQNKYLPKELVSIAGELNLCIGISIYAKDAFDFIKN
ncbi:hypothetical protein FACS1894172_19350 [Spirochaetia bacterium]|nr:hypothetical protein FACS1894172_19350 [Spirochaetia bacterium]